MLLVSPKGLLLLHEEIRDDNVANNGGVFIIISGFRVVCLVGPDSYNSLEDQKCDKIIPWEVDLKSKKKLS